MKSIIKVNIIKYDGETEIVKCHSPFTVFGELFAVTPNIDEGWDKYHAYRVSHVNSGIAVPMTFAKTIKEAAKLGRNVLEMKGEQGVKEALINALAYVATRMKEKKGENK